jgi:addiction module HigA family antidote
MLPKYRPPPHPGDILQDFIVELKMTRATIGKRMGVSVQTVGRIVNGKRSIDAETAVRLSRSFRNTPQFWMNLQTSHDFWHAM